MEGPWVAGRAPEMVLAAPERSPRPARPREPGASAGPSLRQDPYTVVAAVVVAQHARAGRAGWAGHRQRGRRGGHHTDSLSRTPGSREMGNPYCRLGSPGLEALLSPPSAIPLQGPEKLCDHLEEDSRVRGPESPVHDLAGR